jgi:DNA-binding GntR family transcriptional regulator
MPNVSKLPAERMRPIRDEVYHRIRQAILRGVYRPGDRLQEEALAEALGTSRTPVREALRKLEVELFVTYYPHKGTVVSSVSPDEIDDLYRVRTVIEVLVTRRAAIRSTPEDTAKLREILALSERCVEPDEILDSVELFNDALFEIADAPSLVDINRRIRELLQRVLASNHLDPARRARAQKEHLRIVGALEANDPDLAEKYTLEHLANSPRTPRELVQDDV